MRTDPGALRVYGHDATPLFRGAPDAVVLPASTEEVAGVLRVASERAVPVIPRGAGSNLSAGTIADRGGIMLALTRMNRLLELDHDNLVAVAQPGLPTALLGAAAEAQGLLYPPDPGSRTTSTIGGNVAENAGGMRGLKYGVTRDYVLGCEAVLATGEVIRAGGKLVKDVAGYDLVRLLCGSEGTLAVMTELTVRLVPAPEATGVGLAYFASLAAAGRAVSRSLRNGVAARHARVPRRHLHRDRGGLRAHRPPARCGRGADLRPGRRAGGCGARPRADRRRLPGRGRARGQDGDRCRRGRGHHGGPPRRAALAVPARPRDAARGRDSTALPARQMVERIEAIGERHGLRIGTFGHAGDGNLHPTVRPRPDDDPEPIERAHKAFAEIFAAAIELGGTITGEHGVGLAKLPFLEARHGADHVRCCAASSTPSTRRASSTRASWALIEPAAGRAERFGSSPELLDRCISCGFCLPACPTYVRTGMETSSPRGRIDLMRAVETGELAIDDPTVQEESSFCLGCRACEPVCPAGVQYGALLEEWRDHAWDGRGGGGRVLGRCCGRSTGRGGCARWALPAPRPPLPENGPQLMLGCFERALYPGVSRAVRRLVPDVRVDPGAGCCGALHAHNGDSERGHELAEALGRRLDGTILTTAGGCAAHLASVLGRERVRELSEYLAETDAGADVTPRPPAGCAWRCRTPATSATGSASRSRRAR